MKIRTIAIMSVMSLLSVPAFAETLFIRVNGMVCGFCAQGIEKKFKEESTVQEVKVDLGQKLVTVQTKENEKLSDEKVRAIISDAGYALKGIERK